MRYLLCCLCVSLLVGAAHADYPTPQAAGFHHCALIYETSQRGVAQLTPYAADERGWLFDAFLFLRFQTSTGVSCSYGQTRLADWRDQLDTWFAPGRDLAALDQALEQLSTRFGPPPPRRVMLSIPYPHPALDDFGDVDGDGTTEDLSTAQGRESVARWYVAEVMRRFAAADFRHLQLWGLYWMREDVSDADAPAIAAFSRAIHEASLRLLWIPYYHAPNWSRWRELGFDVAIMQPNYAFLRTHHGSVRRNRLAINAADARAHGLGVEIELPMSLHFPGAPRLFREYLRDGAAERYGYQHAATAYYLGTDWIEKLAAARDPLYADLAAYVHGDTLPEPDLPVHWEIAGEPAPWLSDRFLTAGRPLSAAQATVPPQPLEALDVFLDEPDTLWTGLLRVDGQPAPGEPWQPVGWALRSGRRADDRRYQVVTVPLRGSWHTLRLRCDGDALPTIAELTPLGPTLTSAPSHLALGASYQVSPPDPPYYGDSGCELTDGTIPDTGFPSGQTVGWIGATAAVTFDLGDLVEITGGEAHLQGGSGAGVFWPRTAVLLLAADYPPPPRGEGLGAPPSGLVSVPSAELVLDRTRSATDQDGHLSFIPAHPVQARFATFLFQPHGWLMLSELRLLSGDRNVLAGRPYRLQPAPTPVRNDPGYPDDGLLLTDGIIAQSFGRSLVYGWADATERTIEVDLGRTCSVDEIVVWSLTGSRAAIFLPSSVKLSLSEDGQTWIDLGEASPATVPEEPPTPCRFTLSLERQPARFFRVVVTPSTGWSMLSEIQISGTPQ